MASTNALVTSPLKRRYLWMRDESKSVEQPMSVDERDEIKPECSEEEAGEETARRDKEA